MQSSRFSIINVNVVFVDIPENEIASYITATKLLRDTLTKGQRACIVINLYYEEERPKAKLTQGTRTDIMPEMARSSIGSVNDIISAKSGVGRSNITYLLAVWRNRPDLYEKVFDGSYSIGKAHTQMKLDEAPPTTEEERQEELNERSTQIVENIAINSPL